MIEFLLGIIVCNIFRRPNPEFKRENFEGENPKYKNSQDYLSKTGDVRGAQDLVMIGPQSGWYNKG